MTLSDYTITNDGVWIPRKVLKSIRDHYFRVADENKKAWVDDKDKFRYPFYLGKVEVMTDLLKHFDDDTCI